MQRRVGHDFASKLLLLRIVDRVALHRLGVHAHVLSVRDLTSNRLLEKDVGLPILRIGNDLATGYGESIIRGGYHGDHVAPAKRP